MSTFSLNNDYDIREHVVNSCLESKECSLKFQNKFLFKSENIKSNLLNLMKEITNNRNENQCIKIIKLESIIRRLPWKYVLGYINRSLILQNTLRTLILPFLYHLNYCPNPKLFVKFLNFFLEIKSNNSQTENQFHFSGSKFHALQNKLIRFSEYSSSFGNRLEFCLKEGKLVETNFIDPCEMIFDYNAKYSNFLYKPVRIDPNDVKSDKTRIVIVSGKWDSQTPYEAAREEFEKINSTNKFLFVADHLAHGVIDADQSKFLSLDLFLNFMFSGENEIILRNLFEIVNSQNLNWDPNFNNQMNFNIWDFDEKSNFESNDKLFVFLFSICCLFLIPILSLSIIVLKENKFKRINSKNIKKRTQKDELINCN
jgi:hypothetical protein